MLLFAMILLFFQVWHHNTLHMFAIAHSILFHHWSSLIWGLCFTSIDFTQVKLPLFLTQNQNHPSQFNFLIQSASPLVSVLFLEEDRHLIVGSADGQVSDCGTEPLFITRYSCALPLPYRYGAFLYTMTSSVTWWPKWILRRWKKDIKVIVGLWATKQVIYPSYKTVTELF